MKNVTQAVQLCVCVYACVCACVYANTRSPASLPVNNKHVPSRMRLATIKG